MTDNMTDNMIDQTTDQPTGQTAPKVSPIKAILAVRNFQLLWIGEAISLLGDQFYMIALPWLVLQLTGSALAVGTILAVAGIPRAVFMLVGGALTDRFSPRSMMLASNIARLILVSILTALVLTGTMQLWMLYVLSLLFGLADAFFFPAQSSIVPRLLEPEYLQVGNAFIQGTAMLSVFIGPVLAGFMIAALSGNAAVGADKVPDVRGIGLAFGIDALSFVASAFTLLLIKAKPLSTPAAGSENVGLLSSIREGLLMVWNNPLLRIVFMTVAALNLLINGPFAVGVPLLAGTRLPEGAAAFGIIMSAFGGGSLLGIVLSGVLPPPAPESTMSRLLMIVSIMGIGLALIGLAQTTLVAALLALVMGTSNGYTNILAFTWLQKRTPDALLGRVMGLLMFAAVGLNPISTALAGVLAGSDPTWMLFIAGSLMTAFAVIVSTNSTLRSLEAQHS